MQISQERDFACRRYVAVLQSDFGLLLVLFAIRATFKNAGPIAPGASLLPAPGWPRRPYLRGIHEVREDRLLNRATGRQPTQPPQGYALANAVRKQRRWYESAGRQRPAFASVSIACIALTVWG